LQALGKRKSAHERNKRRNDWKHELDFFRVFFNIKIWKKFPAKKKKKKKEKKFNIILYYSRKTPNIFL
jgi:hypothetical protein